LILQRKHQGQVIFMYGVNSKRMTDVELMGLAKWRVTQRNIFKWHIGVYMIASVILIAIFFFVDSGHFWPLWSILGWGLIVAFHGIGVNMVLLDSNPTVSDEYNRLKGYAIVAEKMSGGISSEEND